MPSYGLGGRVVGHLPVAVRKPVWTDNFGLTRLIYGLTCLGRKLVKIDTGDYRHYGTEHTPNSAGQRHAERRQ